MVCCCCCESNVTPPPWLFPTGQVLAMASFRRSSSHDRPLPNGTAPFPPSPSPPSANATNTAASACLSSFKAAIALSDSMLSLGLLRCCPVVHKPKGKNQLWKRPFLHAIVCFLVGFVLGLTPFSWPGIAFFTHKARRELAMELKSFTSNFQRDVGAGSVRERQLENVKLDPTAMRETSSSNKKAVDLSLDAIAENQMLDLEPRKLLIIITPTYNRPFQALYLNRMAHTLKLVPPPLLWLVVEMPAQTMETASILRRTGVMYRHLVCDKNLTNVKDRGVHQRNVALEHIERHQLDGIVYFADDDNVYTLELFEQMRTIKRFGTWPVGMLAQSKAKTIIEGPVCEGNNVTGWHTNEKSKHLRRFHVDMSGFAFNSTILWDPRRWRRPTADPIRQLDTVKEGFQETTFIEQVVEDESQMEGLPIGCSKVMVWHLHLETPALIYPPGWVLKDPLNATMLFN